MTSYISKRLATAAFLFTIVPNASVKAQESPSEWGKAFVSIYQRGRELVEYDGAAWQATDALLTLGPLPSTVTHYIARRTNGEARWSVVFGWLNEREDAFLVAYEARGTIEDGFSIEEGSGLSDTGYYLRAARAIDLARAALPYVDRPYNVTALVGEDGGWWVYLMPAPTQPGVWPLGGDSEYHVSPDGRTMIDNRKLHREILEVGPSPKGTQAGTHTHVLDNIPGPTDVFHVLRRTPKVPEYIVTDRFIFKIAANGGITLLGGREDLLGQ